MIEIVKMWHVLEHVRLLLKENRLVEAQKLIQSEQAAIKKTIDKFEQEAAIGEN